MTIRINNFTSAQNKVAFGKVYELPEDLRIVTNEDNTIKAVVQKYWNYSRPSKAQVTITSIFNPDPGKFETGPYRVGRGTDDIANDIDKGRSG